MYSWKPEGRFQSPETCCNAIIKRMTQVPRRPKRAVPSAAGRRKAAAAHSAKVAAVSTTRATRPGAHTYAGELARAALEARANSQWALLDSAAVESDYQDAVSRIQVPHSGLPGSVLEPY